MQEERHAQLPEGTDAGRARFAVADACRLPANLAPVDAVLAANLLCRLPRPRAFLGELPRLLRPQGVVVLVTPWSWLPAWTAPPHWLGGRAVSSVLPARARLGLLVRACRSG